MCVCVCVYKIKHFLGSFNRFETCTWYWAEHAKEPALKEFSHFISQEVFSKPGWVNYAYPFLESGKGPGMQRDTQCLGRDLAHFQSLHCSCSPAFSSF